jgi:hypothetical protein
MLAKVIVLLAMIYFHIRDDYYDQPAILSKLKCKCWWEQNYPQPVYKNDYRMALFTHAFSWTFSIHIPLIVIMVYNYFVNGYTGMTAGMFSFLFILNVAIHYFTDDMKANKGWINLVTDQLMHYAQIILTWCMYALTVIFY